MLVNDYPNDPNIPLAIDTETLNQEGKLFTEIYIRVLPSGNKLRIATVLGAIRKIRIIGTGGNLYNVWAIDTNGNVLVKEVVTVDGMEINKFPIRTSIHQ